LHIVDAPAFGAGPKSILPTVVMDCGLARSLSSGGAERHPLARPGMTVPAERCSTNGAVFTRRLDPAHPSASAQEIFAEQACAKDKIVEPIQQITRRANHQNPVQPVSEKYFA